MGKDEVIVTGGVVAVIALIAIIVGINIYASIESNRTTIEMCLEKYEPAQCVELKK